MSQQSIRLVWRAVCILAMAACALPTTAAHAQTIGRGRWLPTWTVEYGGYKQCDDLAAAGETGAWCVDATVVTTAQGKRDQTAFVHFDGSVWRAVQFAEGVHLRAIAMSGSRFGVAVGDRGAIWQFDGVQWRAVPSGTNLELRDVAVWAPNEAWASGVLGTVLRWDGRSWRRTPTSYENLPMQTIAAAAFGDAWSATFAGDLIHFVDDQWFNENTPHITQPIDLAFAAPDHGMVVGVGALELREGLWRQAAPPTKEFSSVTWAREASADVAYAASHDRLERYENQQWSQVPFAPAPVDLSTVHFTRVARHPAGTLALGTDGTTVRIVGGQGLYMRPAVRELFALDVISGELGWAGGNALSSAFVGLQDGRWSLEPPSAAGLQVLDIDLVSKTDGWAVGFAGDEPGEARMWRWDGAAWRDWPIDKTWVLNFVDMVSPTEGWASGFNVVVHWDGSAWQLVPGAPAGAAQGALAMLHNSPAPEGFFGGRGRIYHMHDSRWDEQPLPGTSARVQALAAPSADEGWAVTDNALFRYQDGSWKAVSLPVSRDAYFWDVDASEPGNAWVLVEPDGLYHWTGSRWEWHDLSQIGGHAHPDRLRALTDPTTGATDVWLAGDPPTIARYHIERPFVQLYIPVVRMNQ